MGVVAQHSATDACYGWPEYVAMVGARFNGHPWTTKFTVEVVGKDHPATVHLDPRFRWEDEIYQFRDLRPDARVLLQMRLGEVDPAAEASTSDTRLPLAWCFEEGQGRVFYTALGHFPTAYEYPTYLRHLSGGLSWVLGYDK
jgi:type 1 glutamine amidotransferase